MESTRTRKQEGKEIGFGRTEPRALILKRKTEEEMHVKDCAQDGGNVANWGISHLRRSEKAEYEREREREKKAN